MRVFISYRRDDSGDVVGRVRDRLAASLDGAEVFTDIDSIPPGRDFREQIGEAIKDSDVVLVLIGPRWLTAVDDEGRRRLTQPDDYVRLELELALDRSIPMIPVLVLGAEMPDGDELPKTIRPLAFHQAVPVRRDPDFHTDIDRLLARPPFGLVADRGAEPRSRGRSRTPSWTVLVAALVGSTALVGAVAWWWAQSGSEPPATTPSGSSASVPPTDPSSRSGSGSALPTCAPEDCRHLGAVVEQDHLFFSMLFDRADEQLVTDLTAAQDGGFFDPRRLRPDLIASGTAAGKLDLRIVLQARTTSQVVITDLRVVVDDRGPLRTGDYVTTPADGCGGYVEPLFGVVRLDEPRAPLRLWRHSDETGQDTPLTYPWALSVSQTESEVLFLTAFGLDGVTSWHLEVDHTAGGEQATMVIDDVGEPFVVAGIDQDTPRYDVVDGEVLDVVRVSEKDGLFGTCVGWPEDFPHG